MLYTWAHMLLMEEPERESAELSGIVKVICDLVSLEERQVAGLTLDGSDESTLATLRSALEDPGRRRHQRFSVELPAVVRARSKRWSAEVLDISGGGMQITTTADLDPEDPLQVTIGSGGSFQVSFPCRVKRASDRSLGICFDGVPVQMRRDREPASAPDLVSSWRA